MVVECMGWRVVPFNDLCWRLEKWIPDRGDAPGHWYGVDCYHARLEDALEALYDRASRGSGQRHRADTDEGRRALIDALEGIRKGIAEACRRAGA